MNTNIKTNPKIKQSSFFKTFFSSTIIAATFALTGCSQGPSEAEIRASLEKEIEPMLSMMKMMGMKDISAADLIKEIEKHSCEEVENREGVYNCEVTVTAVDPLTKKEDSNTDFQKFRQDKDGNWQAVN